MVKRKTANIIRKSHRYLGLFLGLQFLMWTISGIYFSWTNLDEIHGDHFKNTEFIPAGFNNLISPSELPTSGEVRTIALRDLNGEPHYWVNHELLFHAVTGEQKDRISQEEALYVASERMNPKLKVASVALIEEVGPHHEYREKLLPAYVISYQHDEALKAYISAKDGQFQTVRHRAWRWFDFLWMTHTMDYQTRDNFNTTVLRAFSLLGLITVLSGFTLWFISSPTARRLIKRINS